MKSEELKQEINNYIEIRKNIWTVVIILSSGLAGLGISIADFKFHAQDYVKVILFIIGIFLDYTFISSINSINKEIKKLITDIGKEINK